MESEGTSGSAGLEGDLDLLHGDRLSLGLAIEDQQEAHRDMAVVAE